MLKTNLRRAAAMACAGVLVATAGHAETVRDSAGREVIVPEVVDRVFAAGPPASILVYVVRPDALTGWPRALRDNERPYIAEAYRDLPELGRLTGRGDTANLEVVLGVDPQVIIDFGSVRDTFVSLANQVQQRTGIPYALIDGRFEATPDAFRLTGRLLGVPGRAEALARYTEDLFAEIDAVLAEIPFEDRPSVYLARGPDGLETGLVGSINTEIIERAGGRNVADPGDADVRRGLVRASMEQILNTDPDIIVTWDRLFFENVWRDPLWQQVRAVREGHVYLSPVLPFGWIDRPPSVNRLIGLRWMLDVLYPDRVDQDLRAETRRFYDLFYHVDLDEQTLDTLLAGSRSGRP